MFEPLESRIHFSAGPVPGTDLLSTTDVSTILAQAASQARPGQAIAVTDRQGNILGVYSMTGATPDTISKAIARARTGGLFESTQQTFSTRTARFIIQDHFPPGVRNTAGGPLYGVQFSSLPDSDVIDATLGDTPYPSVSGDPGGLSLYKNKTPVGGIGVAGDGHDLAARSDLLNSTYQGVYNAREEKDFDESVALAGEQHYAPSNKITANNIFVAGLRLPYVSSPVAKGKPAETLDQLTSAGAGTLTSPITGATPPPYPETTIAGVPGQLKNPFAPGYGIIGSPSSDPNHLTADDVTTIITQAVKQALKTRAAIRLPIGVHAVVHISVCDADGNLLGVFRMNNDGTNFSYDVSVQKARTAAFFSDDTHAFSTRAIGFMAQSHFAPSANVTNPGPLFHVQNEISSQLSSSKPLPNGMTIFPGGEPLYKNGHLVGGIGVSGDGVDQDDLISYAGATGFRPVATIRSDDLSKEQIRSFIVGKMNALKSDFIFDFDPAQQANVRLENDFKNFRLPYVKLPRNPQL